MTKLISTRNERCAIVMAHKLDESLSEIVSLMTDADHHTEHFLSLVFEALSDLNHRPRDSRFINRIWKHCEQLADDVREQKR